MYDTIELKEKERWKKHDAYDKIISDFFFLGNRTNWEFGWAYGVGWGAVIFLVGGAVLLLCEKESEEIYYKEKKTVRDDIGSGGSMIGMGHHAGRSGTQLA